MKSSVVKVDGKLFRYDFDRCVVEYISKASKKEIAEENEWIAKYGTPLVGIDDSGYMVLSTAGLHTSNWKNREARNEYLTEWAAELQFEFECMVADFEKYELPLYQKNEV